MQTIVSESLFPAFLGMDKPQLNQWASASQGQAYLQQQIAAHYPGFHQKTVFLSSSSYW